MGLCPIPRQGDFLKKVPCTLKNFEWRKTPFSAVTDHTQKRLSVNTTESLSVCPIKHSAPNGVWGGSKVFEDS